MSKLSKIIGIISFALIAQVCASSLNSEESASQQHLPKAVVESTGSTPEYRDANSKTSSFSSDSGLLNINASAIQITKTKRIEELARRAAEQETLKNRHYKETVPVDYSDAPRL